MTEQLKHLHDIYCRETGLEIGYRYDRERIWYEFVKAGFTQADLVLVIHHLKAGIKRRERHSGSLKFSNMIECLNYFEEDLAQAKAHLRNNKPQTNRENIIKAFRPEASMAPPIETSKPAKEIVNKLINDLKRAAQ